MTRLLLACSGLLLCVGAVTHAIAADPQASAALKATNYVRTLQGTDGGFPDFADTSTPSATLDAVFAFGAAGIDPRTVERGGKGPDDYLATQASSFSSATPGGAAKLVAGLATMDIDPMNFGGIDALAAMEANYQPATGKYGDDAFAQALFILAERSLSRPVPAASAAYLISLQKPDGGWEFCCGFGTDTNSTATAVRALVAAGTPSNDPAVVAAVEYLHANQNSDGGFPYAPPFESDANSTAYVIQAIVALGQSADAGGPWDLGGGANPLANLLSFQNPATGALIAFGADSPFATYQGIPGLVLKAFPEQEQPSSYTPTATSTTTSTATATPISTSTAASTATPSSTAGASVATATVAAVTTIAPGTTANTPTAINAVLGVTVPPPAPVHVAALPNTGRGGPDPMRPVTEIAFALSGATLILAGIAAMRKGGAPPEP